MPPPVKTKNRIAAFVSAILFFLSCAFVLIVLNRIAPLRINAWSGVIYAAFATVITFGLTMLFVHWDRLQLSDIGVLPRPGSIRRWCVGFLFGSCIAFLQPALVFFGGHMRIIWNEEMKLSMVIPTLLLFLLAACREELAFHGYPLRRLQYGMNSWLALTVVSLVFALEHIAGGYTWQMALLGAGTGSILFGLAALKTKGIALPIGLHAAWNCGQWAIGFKNEPGIWRTIIDQGYETQVENTKLVCYLAVMLLAILITCYYPFKKREKALI